MKIKKSNQIQRGRAAKISRKPSARRRPVHKRVLLHPLTTFVLLCVGVLTLGATFRSDAISYDVTARVEAPPITAAAVIAEPADGQHLTLDTVTIRGTCPADSYVKLYKAEIYSGSSVCADGQFSIQVALEFGGNRLQARVFNLTDNEGPAGATSVIYRDLPLIIPPPPAPPEELRVVNVDETTYQRSIVTEATDNPTISGYAPPFSDVTVEFHSDPVFCKTKANAQGLWTCTLPTTLPPGVHQVFVTAITRAGKKLSLPPFQVAVVQYAQPFWISSEYKYQGHLQGKLVTWKMALNGGTAPFDLSIDWGDGSTSKLQQKDRNEFELSHTYDNKSLTSTDYVVLVRASDARGATTVLQFNATIKGLAAPTVASKSGWATFAQSLHDWLWVVWPTYIAVMLMAISFWIGEREAYQRFVARRRATRRQLKGGHR